MPVLSEVLRLISSSCPSSEYSDSRLGPFALFETPVSLVPSTLFLTLVQNFFPDDKRKCPVWYTPSRLALPSFFLLSRTVQARFIYSPVSECGRRGGAFPKNSPTFFFPHPRMSVKEHLSERTLSRSESGKRTASFPFPLVKSA